MLDLDAIQARAEEKSKSIDAAIAHLQHDASDDQVVARLRAWKSEVADEIGLAAELSAAREVVEASREVGHGPTSLHWNPQCIQCRALAAYDKLTEEGSR